MDLSQIGLKMNVTTKYSGKRSLLFLTIERATFWKMFLFCRTNSSFFTDIKMFVWAERTCWSKRSTRSLSRLDIPAEVLSSRWGHHFISSTLTRTFRQQFSWLRYKDDLEQLSSPHWSLLSTLHLQSSYLKWHWPWSSPSDQTDYKNQSGLIIVALIFILTNIKLIVL